MWFFKKDLKKIKEKYEKELFKKRGVVAVGCGHKITKGIDTGEDCISVYVRTKLPEEMLLKEEIVPKKIGGVKTDVVEIGFLEPLQSDHKKKHRPSPAGTSCGHYKTTAGTIGAFVTKNGKTYLLTNAHVGFPHWNGAKKDDLVLQPGPADGGKVPSDIIGKAAEVVEIKDEDNLVDACLVEVNPYDIQNYQFGLGELFPETAPRVKVGDVVIKSSRTSGVNEGKVIATDVTAMVNYRKSNGTKWLTKWKDQVFLSQEPVSVRAGDSGSLFLQKETMKPALLVFAGSNSVGVANQIDNVKRLLGFQWIGEKEPEPLTGYIAYSWWWKLEPDKLPAVVLRQSSFGGAYLRSTPEIADNKITLLKKDTLVEVLEYSGFKNNYHWLKVKLVS